MTVREKAELIVKDIKKEQGTNPVVIFKQIAEKEYISIHGPEHHILDGASLLVAYKNAGGEIDLEQALDRLMSEGLRMPGAMCGLWIINQSNDDLRPTCSQFTPKREKGCRIRVKYEMLLYKI